MIQIAKCKVYIVKSYLGEAHNDICKQNNFDVVLEFQDSPGNETSFPALGAGRASRLLKKGIVE